MKNMYKLTKEQIEENKIERQKNKEFKYAYYVRDINIKLKRKELRELKKLIMAKIVAKKEELENVIKEENKRLAAEHLRILGY